MAGSALQAAFSDAVKPRGCLLWPLWPLRGINKTAWGAKLILTAYPVSCASLGHLPMAKHCPLSLKALPRLRLPTRPHHPFHPPTCPPPIDSIHVIAEVEKPSQKPGAYKQLVELAMKY